MNDNEFTKQMSRLTETFGKGNYGQERVRLIWKIVSQFEARWLENFVDSCISTMRQSPLVSDFNEAANAERSRSWDAEKKAKPEDDWNIKYDCDFCKDVGIYLCTNKSGSGLSAFRCHCVKGNNDSRKAIPQFKVQHEIEGLEWFDMPNKLTQKQVSA